MGIETKHVCDYCRKVDEYGLYLCGECYNKAKRKIAGLMKQMGATVVSTGR